MSYPKYPQVHVSLGHSARSSRSIIRSVAKALHEQGIGQDEVRRFRAEALNGDFMHAMDTADDWVRTF